MKPLLAFVSEKLCRQLQLNNILIVSPAKYYKIHNFISGKNPNQII